MPFSFGQMFGGWRKKEGKKTTSKDSPHPSRSRLTFPRNSGGSDATRVSDEARPSKSTAAKPKGESDFAWELIRAPHISEKATMQGDGKYVFKVADNATKGTLKQAVEDRYGVMVKSLRMLNMPSKKRNRGGKIGIKSGFKKAIVALKEGQTISEF